jgi:hypothetical protein
MRILRPAALATAVIAVALLLSGCGTSFFTDGFGVPVTASPTPTFSASPTPTQAPPKPTPTPTESLGGWVECPRIITDLNRNAADPATYKQVKASAFPVKEVGSGVLGAACVIQVTTGGESVYWAVLPGDASLAASIKGNLIDAGFVASGLAGTLSNSATSEGALVSAFATGADLETFLGGPKGFARLAQPLVYVGSFFLS